MIKAYVILAHKNPIQLNRLIKALHDGNSVFFVHIDKRVNLQNFESLQHEDIRIVFVQREKTSWGSFEIVEAILHGMRAVRDSGDSFRQIILLSGQDYPIKSNAYISRFAEENTDKIFLEYYRLPDPLKWQPNGGLFRVNKYFIGFKTHQRLLSRTLNFLSGYLPFLQRRVYDEMASYAGSMWWIFNMHAVDYILDFLDSNPGYTAFHKYTFAADEVFFHMILLNAREKELKNKIVNTDKRFIKWKSISASHPEIIDKNCIHELISTDALFARKFDEHRDSEVLDLIDHYRNSSES